jgi:tetratricopeptide (TPR) repeat protein
MLKRTLHYSLALTLLAASLSVSAASKQDEAPNELIIQKEDHIFVPDTPIQQANKDFSFDWNNYPSIASNKEKVKAVEDLLQKNADLSKVKTVDKEPLGELNYKLGTFYTHVIRDPNIAITQLEQANLLLTNKDDKDWIADHLGYAYELKKDKEKALSYTNQVLADSAKNLQTKQVAFAYCVQGLVQNDSKDYAGAEANFKKAIKIYESVPDGTDVQYARAKNRLATIILAENGRDKEAITMLEQLKKYWLAMEGISQSPYAARNFLSLGKAYLKTGNAKGAQEEFDRAITIYQNVYGINSPMLIDSYQLKAASYQKLGNTKEAQAYVEKAKILSQMANSTSSASN